MRSSLMISKHSQLTNCYVLKMGRKLPMRKYCIILNIFTNTK
ncbi:unnamed protein product [Nezara viridula]|uniref:Uncharacterized protein n=1 Tax=Nezara viridula TaxID=85310 RepID=A0A9P0MVH2_NEZVI|nr:unnamed protein product [Nezara viridula]